METIFPRITHKEDQWEDEHEAYTYPSDVTKEIEVTIEEIEAVKNLKLEKAMEIDNIALKMLKYEYSK